MVKIVIEDVLKEKNKTKYWFVKKMNGTFQSLNKLIKNEASAIYFDTIEKACTVLECQPGDIIKLEKNDDEKEV